MGTSVPIFDIYSMEKMKHLYEWTIFNEAMYDTFQNKSGEKFWGEAGAGILPICTSTGRILVGKRSKYVNEPGTWSGFGGMIDDDDELEDPSLAAKRELEEETGYVEDIKIIPAFVFRSDSGGFVYYNFIGLVDTEYEPEYMDGETDDFKWITLDALEHLHVKHFGLENLLKHSGDIIKKYAK
jgi:8-oxo-dGTP pyrophosphatase MutT (NUDIX family)